MMHDKKDMNDEYKKKHELFVEKLKPFLIEYQPQNSPSSQLVLAHWIPDSEGKDIVKTLKRCGMLWFSIINLSMAKMIMLSMKGGIKNFIRRIYMPCFCLLMTK